MRPPHSPLHPAGLRGQNVADATAYALAAFVATMQAWLGTPELAWLFIAPWRPGGLLVSAWAALPATLMILREIEWHYPGLLELPWDSDEN